MVIYLTIFWVAVQKVSKQDVNKYGIISAKHIEDRVYVCI